MEREVEGRMGMRRSFLPSFLQGQAASHQPRGFTFSLPFPFSPFFSLVRPPVSPSCFCFSCFTPRLQFYPDDIGPVSPGTNVWSGSHGIMNSGNEFARNSLTDQRYSRSPPSDPSRAGSSSVLGLDVTGIGISPCARYMGCAPPPVSRPLRITCRFSRPGGSHTIPASPVRGRQIPLVASRS